MYAGQKVVDDFGYVTSAHRADVDALGADDRKNGVNSRDIFFRATQTHRHGGSSGALRTTTHRAVDKALLYFAQRCRPLACAVWVRRRGGHDDKAAFGAGCNTAFAEHHLLYDVRRRQAQDKYVGIPRDVGDGGARLNAFVLELLSHARCRIKSKNL